METIATEQPIFIKECPSRAILDRIADKWTVLVMEILANSKKRRFNELRRIIQGISQKMLTQTLRDLERDGLIKRTIYAEIPPRVEYELTDLGRTLCVPLQGLFEWSHDHMNEILAAQAAFDAKDSAA